LATDESKAAIEALEEVSSTDKSVTIPKLFTNIICTENDDKATCNFLEDGESKNFRLG